MQQIGWTKQPASPESVGVGSSVPETRYRARAHAHTTAGVTGTHSTALTAYIKDCWPVAFTGQYLPS